MQEIAEVYARSLFQVAQEQDVLDDVHEQLGQFADAVNESQDLQVFRVRRTFDEMWAEERKRLEVSITSAVELDDDTVKEIGKRIEEQTGRDVQLSQHVDPDVVGGIVLRVGNMILDASVRARLERLRRQVSSAAA